MTFSRKALFDGSPNPKRLDDVDLPRIGATIGVGEDEIHAFMDVEAAGSGFDGKGRVKMLFEPHIFYRQLGAGVKRKNAVAQGLAYDRWRKTGYPVDSYPRLRKAMFIDETAALASCSWGLGQIMGFNHRGAGYATPQDMVAYFMADEDNQLEAMVQLLKHFKIDDDLKARRWDVIENVWNGGGFKGAYAVKMKAAFAKWQKIKDTPYVPSKPDENLLPSPPSKPANGAAAGGAVIVGTGVAAAAGFPWERVLLLGGCALALVAIVILFLQPRKQP